ncbi:MAG: endonuclease domain-containing protein [Patescibacteria group bacterium]
MKRVNNKPELRDRRIELRRNQTPEEKYLWLNLRKHNIGARFKRQHSIGPYILDFYCPEYKLAIEIDGAQHKENREYDKERTMFLREQGIREVRFWNKQVNDSMKVILNRIQIELNSLRPAKGEVSKGRRG